MKFTQDQLKDFAIKAGVPVVEIVADAKDSDYNEDTALQDVHKAITPILKPKIEADLSTSLEPSIKGKVTGQMYSVLARETGLTRSELEKMSVEDAIKHATAHINSKGSADTTALRQEITDLVATHNKNLDALKATHQTELGAAQQRYIDRDIKAYLADNIIGKAPLLEGADKSFWADQLLVRLQSKFHITYDEATKAIQLFKKDQTSVPALNAAGTANINPMDEFKDLATPAGVWKKDMRNNNPGEAMKNAKTEDRSKAGQAVQQIGRRGTRITADQVKEKIKAIEES